MKEGDWVVHEVYIGIIPTLCKRGMRGRVSRVYTVGGERRVDLTVRSWPVDLLVEGLAADGFTSYGP
jgi:hypothetical protein